MTSVKLSSGDPTKRHAHAAISYDHTTRLLFLLNVSSKSCHLSKPGKQFRVDARRYHVVLVRLVRREKLGLARSDLFHRQKQPNQSSEENQSKLHYVGTYRKYTKSEELTRCFYEPLPYSI